MQHKHTIKTQYKRNINTVWEGQMPRDVETNSHGKSTAQIDLYGEYHFKVDSKGRVSLPSKFRKCLTNNLLVSREPQDSCLYVFTANTFKAWIDQLFIDSFGGYDSSNRQHVLLRSKLNRRVDSVEVDSSGRIMLKSDFRDAVGIGKEVVIVGNTGYFEIWNPDKLAQEDENVDLSVLFK